MSNTSDTPDANEQVKATKTRSRTTARAKTESATSNTQAQEEKPTAQRRTASTTHATAAVRTQSAPEKVKTQQAAPEASSTPTQPASPSSTARPATARPAISNTARSTTAQPAPSNVARPATAQPAPSNVARPATRVAAPDGSRSNPAQRSEPGQRSGGTAMPVQRQASNAPAQRTAAPGSATTRPGTRPGSSSPGTYRPGGHGTRTGGRAPGAPVRKQPERRVPIVKEKPTGPISIPPQIVVKDLAELLQTTPNDVIRGLIKHSIFASINQVVDYDKAALVATDLGFEPNQSELTVTPAVQRISGGLSANEAMMATRHEDNMDVIPPVVTIMGHVDHGKTSLLDTIRKTKVAAGEAGGITQHIGAYQVEVDGKKITFLDTPGHEAFTAMRARGAQVTHIAVIVVAADDGVMPQTREAIDHAQAAKVPIIIALNKIDKVDANPDFVKQQLYDIGVVIEEFGGDVICVPVSARKGIGIDELLEMILLVAEVQDIRANPNRPATGVIIEAKLEKNTGAVATVLIQQGTLKMGDNIVVGSMSGKVRAMFNDRGKRIQKAPPSTPVSILGLPEVPQAGDRLEVVSDERKAKQAASKIAEQRRNESIPLGQVSLDTLYMQMQEGKVKELNVVLKCDVQGSAEAIKNALSKVGEENIKVRLIHEGIGNINETDVHLAGASDAVIIGFNVKADGAAQRLAQKENVEIRYYDIIYKLTDDIQAALTGMLEPTYREVIEGHAEVQQTFKAGKNTVIAGCRIIDGKITRSSQARVLRKTEMVYDGKIASLRRGRDDVREVATGYECGIVLEDFTEFEEGDIIEAYAQERVKPGM
ncbi:MAG TPA: translation initiation factor IF-2 [Ktedonobacteraceae bacterium]|nr:translation initiation factor IF-2 [Ktedonobacteraceae bacterium]